MADQVRAKITAAAAKNKELLAILQQTDHAIPSLEQQRRLVKDLEGEVRASDARVAAVDRKRKKEYHEHEKYRDSVLKRFAYKATGKREKFEQRAAKEEQEYFEALQEEHRETEINKDVKIQLQEARRVAADLERDVARHNDVQKQLDELYGRIFGGPTPGYPEEDEQEREANARTQAYQATKGKSEAERQALKILGEGQLRMKRALGFMEEALMHSRRDMFGGGTFTDMMERNALSQAEREVMSANMLVMQAQRMSPRVTNLPQVNIDQGNLMMDVFFDNIFTDMAFHDKIKASRESVLRAAMAMDGQVAATRQRVAQFEGQLRVEEQSMREAREKLQKVRERVFETVAASTPPPAYEP
ncbi:hypothetical protein QC763_100290 [Podospora pseudopauciseta]|uniref:Uncharacterized protein n=2 Tax=Podospora TaxID=5144 RepID=A0ABR0HW17_9PEZI|nr:hypothetical protein QC763_100290 [Podospora pseudopauciseta]KAK4680645.1 hypothetical protein QC764_100290 [Podospora pseudoanserina]